MSFMEGEKSSTRGLSVFTIDLLVSTIGLSVFMGGEKSSTEGENSSTGGVT